VTDESNLLQLLADREWHSGTELSRKLGITRAAISARIKKLTARGLSIYAVVGRGYRLAQTDELLDSATIHASLPPTVEQRVTEVRVFETIDSTNDVLARLDDGSTRLAVAEMQTAGRGRTGRRWVSPFGANLHFSLIHRFREPQAPISSLSPLIGICLARMLYDMGLVAIRLKWPNDLMVHSEKLGGILVDYRGEIAGSARLIIGVGINVAMGKGGSSEIDQPWTELAAYLPKVPSRNELTARVATSVMTGLDRFKAGDTNTLPWDWQAFDHLADASVITTGSNAPMRGIARGINTDGSLRIETDGVVSRVYSGDVSVRSVS